MRGGGTVAHEESEQTETRIRRIFFIITILCLRYFRDVPSKGAKPKEWLRVYIISNDVVILYHPKS